MPARENDGKDLHGNVPDQCPVALLLVDVINDLEFPKNEYLVSIADRLAASISQIKRRCRELAIPVLYVNDNHGKWRSDVNAVLTHCLREDSPGRTMVQKLHPTADDYIVLKPKHSAFFATPLEAILQHMGVNTAIVVGITTSACIMITAGDVYVRGYRLYVPSDCVASLTEEANSESLRLMHENYSADITPSQDLDLHRIIRESR